MIASLLLAGCQIDTTPQDVAKFSSNRAAVKDTADYHGTFVLYRDDVDNTAQPVITSKHLDKGDIYGFELDEHQVPFAVAGKDRIQLTSGRYRWEMRPDPGQVDWQKTNAIIVNVVIFTVGLGGLTILALVIAKNA
jgi:hypothetical protein